MLRASHIKSLSAMRHKIFISIFSLATLSVLSDSTVVSYVINIAYAESGMGKDVFKVMVSIFGVTKETGDIVATVTVNGNSRIKSFDVDSANLEPTYVNSTQEGSIIEFVTTFPGVVVNSEDVYKACVLKLNTMDRYCEEGHNSPAKRSELVDISLERATKVSDSGKKIKFKDNG
ncbi:MAG: hypothetical protein M3530_12560 [Thermoproteota archaeon]|nr:hypothetical protein [Thermoproteota archaeon]